MMAQPASFEGRVRRRFAPGMQNTASAPGGNRGGGSIWPAVRTRLYCAAPRPGRLAPLLLAGAGLAFVAAGSLLWWRHGAAVFTDFAVAALAWCF